ncbi:hypothetical protein F5Y09DRAFT_347622 [Xylaria sp. FL1042]|nr:hypothetical protein F5Y09DRAFT_347622 [Xylaria sp. FL1042]
MSIHYIESVSSGCGDRVTLSIRWNNARIQVDLDPSPTGDTIQDSLIEKYNAAVEDGDDEEEEMISDQILDAIVQVGRSLFDQLAPPPAPDTSTPVDLHSLIFPKEYSFFFRTNVESNTAELIPKSNKDTTTHEKFELKYQLPANQDLSLPKFSTRDIHVREKLLGDGYIARVSAGGREMCCKVGDELRADASQRELSCLLTIRTSQHAAALRVPKLLGLVEAADDGRIIGLLQEYVPCSDTWELSTLQNVESVSSIAKARREKWASQIQETVHLLHQIGVTWGDGKAANVLIHCDTDDAWIIDFGGGWTDGWVGQELSGTVEDQDVPTRKSQRRKTHQKSTKAPLIGGSRKRAIEDVRDLGSEPSPKRRQISSSSAPQLSNSASEMAASDNTSPDNPIECWRRQGY